MGIMTGAGSLSRVLGPVFVGLIYTRLGTNWTFGITSLMMALSMLWLFIYNAELLPPSVGVSCDTEMKPMGQLEERGDGGGEQENGRPEEKLLKSELEAKYSNDKS